MLPQRAQSMHGRLVRPESKEASSLKPQARSSLDGVSTDRSLNFHSRAALAGAVSASACQRSGTSCVGACGLCKMAWQTVLAVTLHIVSCAVCLQMICAYLWIPSKRKFPSNLLIFTFASFGDSRATTGLFALRTGRSCWHSICTTRSCVKRACMSCKLSTCPGILSSRSCGRSPRQR
jgi:hypothetical protein